jgi:hypothetical protein
MALMLVIPAVALAAVLSYAVLANVGIQDQISANAALLAQADCAAESGINYAMYELDQPTGTAFASSTLWAPPTTATSLGSGLGSFIVTLSNTTYVPAGASLATATSVTTTITSVGTITGSSGGTISRQLTVTVQIPLLAQYPNQAAGVNGNISLASGMQVGSDLRSNGTVTLASGSAVTGSVYAPTLVSTGGTDSSYIQQNSTSIIVPTTVNPYLTYTLNGTGTTYSATRLTTAPASGTTLGPTVSNPAGVYYYTGNLTLSGVTINGTLSVGGKLTIQGTTPTTINATTNFPGLVVGYATTTSTLTVNGSNVNLTVNGLSWVASGVTRAGASNSGSNLNFNGGLMIGFPGSSALGTYNGAISAKYNSQYATVPGFSSQMQVPKNIHVISWSQ